MVDHVAKRLGSVSAF